VNEQRPLLGSSDAQRVFYDAFGGLALGLELAREAVFDLDGVQVAPFITLPVRTFGSLRVPNALPRHVNGFPAVCKISGTDESFSDECCRGANSSMSNERLLVRPGRILDPGVYVPCERRRHLRAIVVQKVLHLTSGDCSFTLHCTRQEAVAEVENPACRSLVSTSTEGTVEYVESVPHEKDLILRRNVERILNLGWQLRRTMQFDVDVEGFVIDATLMLTQLRPIPSEFHQRLGDPLPLAARGRTIHETRFVTGCFDVADVVVSVEDLSGTAGNAIVARVSRHETWSSPPILTRLQAGLPTIILDHVDGFHLSHAPRLLPPCGPLRDAFHSISVHGIHQSLIGTPVIASSDGRIGRLCAPDESSILRRPF
jgi:hypothetical protein